MDLDECYFFRFIEISTDNPLLIRVIGKAIRLSKMNCKCCTLQDSIWDQAKSHKQCWSKETTFPPKIKKEAKPKRICIV